MGSTVLRARRWLTILQAYPDRRWLSPTFPLVGQSKQDVVKGPSAMIIKDISSSYGEAVHLPVRGTGDEKLELHTITIDDGLARTSRTFGVASSQERGKNTS